MSVIETFRETEKNISIFYASQFYEFLGNFLKISNITEFNLVFKNFHFCTEIEIRRALDDIFPKGFIPFFVEENNGRNDYYCFERKNTGGTNRIIVFSEDAIVSEWGTYNDFIFWVKKKMGAMKGDSS